MNYTNLVWLAREVFFKVSCFINMVGRVACPTVSICPLVLPSSMAFVMRAFWKRPFSVPPWGRAKPDCMGLHSVSLVCVLMPCFRGKLAHPPNPLCFLIFIWQDCLSSLFCSYFLATFASFSFSWTSDFALQCFNRTWVTNKAANCRHVFCVTALWSGYSK